MSGIRKRYTVAASGTPRSLADLPNRLPAEVPPDAVIVSIELRTFESRSLTSIEGTIDASTVTITLEWPA